MKKSRQRKPQQNPMAGEFAPPPERQLYSVGFVCGMLQQPLDFVQGLMRLSGVGYASTHDTVGMIRGDDLQRMADKLAEMHATCEAADAKVADIAASN